MSPKLWSALLLAACTLPLGGCLGSTPPSRFYVLTGPNATSATAAMTQPTGPTVYVSGIDLPPYLLVPQIVSRSDDNTLQLAEFDRWGESLRDNFLRVVGTNLGSLLPASQVTTFPWEHRGPVAYHVTIVVTRFDAQDGQVYLSARWGVSSPQQEGMATLRRSEYVAPIAGEGQDDDLSYAALVRAMSGLVGALSSDIAAAIPAP